MLSVGTHGAMMDHSIDINRAQALLATYAEEWADKPIREIASPGTDNAMFMLGDAIVLRIPKQEWSIAALEKELLWLPKLNGLPLAIPEVLCHGESKQDIGFDFGIFSWKPGRIATSDQIADQQQAAYDLACFLNALHQISVEQAPRAGIHNHRRGVDLSELTQNVVSSIDILADEIDAPTALSLWEQACSAGPSGKAVWVHGDLKSDNMIASQGALTAIIDWGLAAVGDPAADYAAAWTWVAPEARNCFRSVCDPTDDDWKRAQGWALHNAVIALSYYRDRSHAALCEQSRRTLRRLELG